jgi:hypothetical protein
VSVLKCIYAILRVFAASLPLLFVKEPARIAYEKASPVGAQAVVPGRLISTNDLGSVRKAYERTKELQTLTYLQSQ